MRGAWQNGEPEVAELYLGGNDMVEITAVLGVPVSMVSDDVDVFTRQEKIRWRNG